MAVIAAMPQAIINTLRQRQKKLMTSARFKGLMFSLDMRSWRWLFVFDVMGL
jgi:hypothetical protein